jgi:exonuclease VII small subunit
MHAVLSFVRLSIAERRRIKQFHWTGKRHSRAPHPNNLDGACRSLSWLQSIFDTDKRRSIRRQGVQQMWKKQDDAQRDFESIGDTQAESLLAESLRNEDSQKRNFAVVSQNVSTEHSAQPLPSPTMQTYTDAIKEFTNNATAFMEQLPLLTRARGAYEEAMRVSAEMRQVLNAHDEKLRTLMAELEQKVNLQDLKSATDKKPPEPARVENLQATDESKGRIRWP